MKRSLKCAMKKRFSDIESISIFSLSCLFDPRYKQHFFWNTTTYSSDSQTIFAQ